MPTGIGGPVDAIEDMPSPAVEGRSGPVEITNGTDSCPAVCHTSQGPLPSESNVCPACHMPFDKGKKRKLIDTCGHERCYTCMFTGDKCPVCRMNNSSCLHTPANGRISNPSMHSSRVFWFPKLSKKSHIRPTMTSGSVSDTESVMPTYTHQGIYTPGSSPTPYQQGYPSPQGQPFVRSKLKTNGHFTAYMKSRLQMAGFYGTRAEDGEENKLTRSADARLTDSRFSPAPSPTPSRRQRFGFGSKLRSSSVSDDEANGPPAPDAARNDLFVRLGLLLGDRRNLTSASNPSSPSPSPRLAHRSSSHVMHNPLINGKNIEKQRPARGVSPNANSQPFHGRYSSLVSLPGSEANTSSHSGGSNNTSPLSTLTGSSEAERFGSGMTHSRTERHDPSSDSMASLTSGSTAASTFNGIRTGTSSRNGVSSDISCAGKSKSSRSKSAEISPPEAVYSQPHIELRPLFFEVPQTEESPLFVGRNWLFREIDEVFRSGGPSSHGVVIAGGIGSGKTSVILQLVDHSCFGRCKDEPFYCEINEPKHCSSSSSLSASRSSLNASRLSLASQHSDKLLNTLGSQVAAYHFCQTDNNTTCSVAEFVHSISAQLCQAPQLVAYREILLNDSHYQQWLSLSECIRNPSLAFTRGVLEPLQTITPAFPSRGVNSYCRKPLGWSNAKSMGSNALYSSLGSVKGSSGAAPVDNYCLIVIDSLNEAEFHRPDHGDTIASFLANHLSLFPPWLKIVVTVRTSMQEVARRFPFHVVSLDPNMNGKENLENDLFDYISIRLKQSTQLRSNVTFNGVFCIAKNNKGKLDSCSSARFSHHLLQLSKGCFLYAKLILDLIERGHLVIKSLSYKVLPVSLSEVFLLMMNLRFQTTHAFKKVAEILNICLASLYPMSMLEIFHSLNAGYLGHFVTWDDFLSRLDILTGANGSKYSVPSIHSPSNGSSLPILVERHDATFVLFHPAFREWLIHRIEGDSTKFLCDPRSGHANIAFRLSRLEAPLGPDKTSELGHHILKAHLYKNMNRQASPAARDLQALWVCYSSADISQALVADRNVYSPNVKVTRLLLLAGSDPNSRTATPDSAPALCCAARLGYNDVVSMLLEFRAVITLTTLSDNKTKNGKSALACACEFGHLEVVRVLLSHGAKLDQIDSCGRFPLTLAAEGGHLPVAVFILQCNWSVCARLPESRTPALQQALIAAARNGHTVICESVLNVTGVDVNAPDPPITTSSSLIPGSGHTALTAAASNGHLETCSFLLRRGASVSVSPSSSPEGDTEEDVTNESCADIGIPPLGCAAKGGHLSVVELLLEQFHALVDQTDKMGRTPLILAAGEGRKAVVEKLLCLGASVTKTDSKGLTALGWACLKGQVACAQLLLDRGSNIHQSDQTGKTALDLAAFHGDPTMVQLLLSRGAMVEHVDHNGMTPLDRAIGCKNTAAVICFLKKGAKLGPSTWTMAADKPDIMLILLNKLLEDGAVLYKKDRLKEAAYRFQYALKKYPSDVIGEEARPFQQLKINLLLSLSRCERKLSEFESAAALATRALEINSNCFEAYYARARARRDMRQLELALDDLSEAIRLSPENRELRRKLSKLQEERKEALEKQQSSVTLFHQIENYSVLNDVPKDIPDCEQTDSHYDLSSAAESQYESHFDDDLKIDEAFL